MMKAKRTKECIKEIGLAKFIFLSPLILCGAIRYKYLLRGTK